MTSDTISLIFQRLVRLGQVNDRQRLDEDERQHEAEYSFDSDHDQLIRVHLVGQRGVQQPTDEDCDDDEQWRARKVFPAQPLHHFASKEGQHDTEDRLQPDRNRLGKGPENKRQSRDEQAVPAKIEHDDKIRYSKRRQLFQDQGPPEQKPHQKWKHIPSLYGVGDFVSPCSCGSIHSVRHLARPCLTSLGHILVCDHFSSTPFLFNVFLHYTEVGL